MKKLTIITFLFFSFIIYGQNLVINPSFENRKDKRCIVFLSGFDKLILDWSTPSFGTPDFFNSCSSDFGIKNYNGYQKPKTGTTFAGIYTYSDKNYREYIQGELSKTLVKGENYILTLYLSLADGSSFVLKDIQVLMTEEKLKPCYNSNACDKAIKPSKATKKQFKLYSNSEEVYFSNKKTWTKFSFEFTAEGYENYFSIGNFYRNSKTKKQQTLSRSPFFFSYYYIDDVSVIALEDQKPEIVAEPLKEEVLNTEPETSIKTNEIYTLKNVLFEFNKAQLLDVSLNELDKLHKHLKENLNLNIEIYGHTDNIGLDKRNKALSEQRAKAVADYLISEGLNLSRIESFGFGSSKPISGNETEEGRQLNRRVEFKVIKN